MEWHVDYLPEALEDLKCLDGSVRPRVVKAIGKVKTNPLPQSRGGYGKPLRSSSASDLSGLMKIRDVLEYIEDKDCSYYYDLIPFEALGLED